MSDPVPRTNVVKYRSWKTEPDGPDDKEIEIFWNANWIPAYFSDLKKDDFFITLNANLNPDQCFLAKSDVKRIPYRDKVTFVIQGMEVVQAPSTVIKESHQIEAPIKLIQGNENGN
jgi:hypothetical protein